VRLNFTERSGLIGVGEARRRYEDAVYAYLVGDFEGAATDFYILTQSRALGNADLARDAEWYFAECLFELGNYRTAEESYRAIVDKGTSHPYFSDAVRRNLEVYGILGDDAGFTSYYNTWIVTGKVPATDLVNYTLAKAFVRRGELPRAKALFDGLGSSSPFYTRARYQMGVLMIKERNLPAAISEFKKVEGAPVTDEEQKRIQGLAVLALGRLYYETSEFRQASAYYDRVEKSSPEFADKLYEAVWSFVKQAGVDEASAGSLELGSSAYDAKRAEADARWGDALSQVDIFLLAFPEHRFTAQLKLLQGHLHMKLRQYDEARRSYEEVIEAYGPVVDRLGEIGADTASAARFLDRIGDTGGTSGLPPYALEMLLGRDDIGRATHAFLDIRELRKQVGDAERTVGELESALSSDSDTLGVFVTARNQLTLMRGAELAMRARLLAAEIGYLKGRSSGNAKTEIGGLQKEVESIGAVDDPASEVGDTTDRLLIYEAQVREVQQRAFRVEQVAQEAVASGKSIAEVLSQGSSKLSAADQEKLRAELASARGELEKDLVELQSAQSEVTRRRIMRTVEAGSVQENQGARAQALARYAALRDRVSSYRRNVQDSDSAAIYAQIDRLWGQVDALEATSSEAAKVVSAGEVRETQAVRQRLAATSQKVTELKRELDARGADTEALAAKVALGGVRGVRQEFQSAIIDAEKGIVDVYWIRKSETSDEQDALVAQQAKLLQELNDRFRVIRENLDR
jgi:tetratricopeptide (TPR) repeat protein